MDGPQMTSTSTQYADYICQYERTMKERHAVKHSGLSSTGSPWFLLHQRHTDSLSKQSLGLGLEPSPF